MGIAAAIAAAANALAEVAKFLQTPEGQASLKDMRENNKAFLDGLTSIGKSIEGFFKGLA